MSSRERMIRECEKLLLADDCGPKFREAAVAYLNVTYNPRHVPVVIPCKPNQ